MANSAPGGPGARAADGAGSGAADERVAAAVAELYDCDPQEFTDRRKALAAAARDAGDAAAAKRIGALRKPTRAAWVVNRLARADPAAPARLAELAAALRAAEQARNGPRLRELSAARGPLIDALTRQALAVAAMPDPPAGLREEVEATLTAALADPEVAAGFAAGTLTRAAQWAGFGAASFAPGPDATAAGPLAAGEPPQWTVPEAEGTPPLQGRHPPRGSGSPGGRQPTHDGPPAEGRPSSRGSHTLPGRQPAEDSRSPRGRGSVRGLPSPTDTGTEAAPARSRPSAGRAPARAAARSVPADEERVAEEAARRAAQRREIVEDAERAVASAAAATAKAVAAEDRLETEVRDLEGRLTKARADLASARLRARQAEAAERRARQAIDRLPRPIELLCVVRVPHSGVKVHAIMRWRPSGAARVGFRGGLWLRRGL